MLVAMVDLRELARRYVWWKPAETTLASPAQLLCQLMQLGTLEDIQVARQLLGDDAFRDALRDPIPGVLDARSWNFWHRFLFRRAPPPLPVRPLPP